MVTQNITILERHLLLGNSTINNNSNVSYNKLSTINHDVQGQFIKRKRLLKEDPMSHRIIEKRRRDRMNNCLADLSRLIPAEYLKKGRGRVEKTEIIEMAIKHMKHLQAHASGHNSTSSSPPQETCEDFKVQHTGNQSCNSGGIVVEHYRLGYQECLSETMHHLVEIEGYYAGEPICVNLISHLQKHCDKLIKGDRLNQLRPHRDGESSSGSSRGYCGGPGSTSSGSDSGGGGHSAKENNPAPADWRHGDTEETSSPVPIISPLPPTLQNLPPPAPALPNCEQDDSLLSLPSESGEPASSSSQLREMLTGNHQQSRGTMSRVSTSSGSEDTGALYKFKNNIKQRFTAEHHDEKRRRIDNNNLVIKRSDSPQQSLPLIKQRQSPSPPAVNNTDSSSNCSPSHQQQNFGVPVFALHNKGSYYVPLTVDNEVLAPYLGSFNENSQVLHPVTISVNFCGVGSNQQQLASPMIPWRGGEPPSLMPLPKWPVCDRV